MSADNYPLPAIYLDPNDTAGRRIAERLNLAIESVEAVPDDWHFICSDGQLVLAHPRHKPFQLSEYDVKDKLNVSRDTPLARACGARPGLTILDALGGWGLDGFVLSTMGCSVTILEAIGQIHVFSKFLGAELGVEANLVLADAESYLQQSDQAFDVVYLDPMFPPHPKSSLPARRMQVLEELAKTDTDLDSLFEQSMRAARNRVVVKHRRNQTSLFEDPDWQIHGKTIRFDVYKTTR